MANKPEKVFRCGLVSVGVFRNDQGTKPFRQAHPQKAFKRQGAEQWEYGYSFTAADACVLQKLMDLAIAYMIELDAKEQEASKPAKPAKGYSRKKQNSDEYQGLLVEDAEDDAPF